MRAAREARKYEQHLDKLNDEVFPHAKNDRVRKMLDATFSIRHALTDGEDKAHSKPLHGISGRVQAPANAKPSLRTEIQKKHAVHKGLKAATVHALVGGLLKPANAGKESSDHKPFDSILGPDSHPDSLHDEFKQYKHALDVTADAVYGDGEKASADAGAVDASKSKAVAGEPRKVIKNLANVKAS